MILGTLAFGAAGSAFGRVNDGLGRVKARTSGRRAVGLDRLAAAELPRNDFNRSDTLGAAGRLREGAGAGRLGNWIRGAGLGEDLAEGPFMKRAPDLGPGASPRDPNNSRTDLGGPAALE